MKRLYVLVLTEMSKLLQWFRGDRIHGITAPVDPAYKRLLQALAVRPPRVADKPKHPAIDRTPNANHDSDEFRIVRR